MVLPILNRLIFVLLSLFLTVPGHAQEEQKLADLYLETTRMLSCVRMERMAGHLEAKEFNLSLAEALVTLEEDNLYKESKALRQVYKDLRKLQKMDFHEQKAKLTSSACQKKNKSVGQVLRTGGFGVSLVWNSIMLPFRMTLRFFDSVLFKRPLFLDLGHSLYGKAFNKVALSLYAGEVLKGVLLNTAYLPVAVIAQIDLYNGKICQDVNKSNPKELKYCRQLKKLKNKFDRLTDKAAVKKKSKASEPLPEIDEKNICEFIHNYLKSGEFIASSTKLYSKQVATIFNPESVVPDKSLSIVTSPENLYGLSMEKRAGLRHVVISLFPELQKDERDEDYVKYLELKKNIKSRYKMLRKLTKTSTLNKCERLQKKLGFDWDEYESLNNEMQYYQHFELQAHGKMVDKQMKKRILGQKLHLFNKVKWEYHRIEKASDLLSLISSQDIGNIVIVSHARSNGQLVDANLNPVPHGLFEKLSPSVQNLILYNCYGQKTLEFYGIEKALSSNKSFHEKRYIHHIDSSTSLTEDQQVPIHLLGKALKGLDADLFKMTKGSLLSSLLLDKGEMTPPAQCLLKLSRPVTIIQGQLTLKLNSDLIGMVSKDEEFEKVFFDCQKLIEGKNRISLQATSFEKTELSHYHFDIILNHEALTPKIYMREGFFSDAHATFILDEN